MTGTTGGTPRGIIAIDSRITKRMLQALAPLPDTAMRLLALLDDPDVPLREIAAVAVRDVGIAATMLRMANSSMFGLRGRVGSISDALRVIGTAQARLLVLASGISQTAQKEMPLYKMGTGSFMRHSELVANVTMYVAHDLRYSNIGLAYSTGLLHDIGKIVINGLAQQQGVAQAGVLETIMRDRSCTLLEAEVALCGNNHAQIGGQLAELWALPIELQRAITQHHDAPPQDDSHYLVWSCIIANSVASQVDKGYPAMNHCLPLQNVSLIEVERVTTAAQQFLHDSARSA